MSEFEDRENLGELPEPISNERGDLTGYTERPYRVPPATPIGTPRPAGVPPDVDQQNQLINTPMRDGTATIGANVTSTFDTRPINAIDFIDTTVDSIEEGEFVNTDAQGDFTVPPGFSAILRGFKITAKDPTFTLIQNPERVTVTVFVNDSPVPFYENMIFIPTATAFNPCHVVADENQVIKVVASIQATIGGTGTDVEYYFQLYGNLLIRTGVPVQYQQGNPIAMLPILPEGTL